ncbi:MAG TPA: signal peptidase II [Tepidisphaeraceae bacterium]|nr:signal peptidase II [Tepidisphaeraceae bacterium]
MSRLTALRSPTALMLFLVTALAGIALDQWSKVAAFERLSDGVVWNADRTSVTAINSQTYRFVPGYVHFEVIANRGAVFGVGQGKRMLFIGVSIAAIFFIFYLFAVSDKQRFYQFILGMLLAGVVGNLYDRIKFEYVRDMIHALPRWPHLFPYIFNVADSLLCVGVFFMIVHSFFSSHSLKQAAQTDPSAA